MTKRFERINYSPDFVYHYTKIENFAYILRDKKIKKGKDTYCFFNETQRESEWILENVTCNPNCKTVDFDGIPKLNRNNIEDYIILKLEVDKNYVDNTKWYKSDSGYGTDEKYVDMINSSICYKGDLRYKTLRVAKSYATD